jgi:putative glycerol-1-phosphate prenyltransferase
MISALDILKDIRHKKQAGLKLLSVLIDPDKVKTRSIPTLLKKFPEQTDYIFVGGSRVENGKTDQIVKTLKTLSSLPVILFPGDVNQITPKADGILFLSLMSGENPEYLIRQQIKSVKQLKHSNLEIIPTGYILINGGKTCTTEKVTLTSAIPQTEVDYIVDVALAAQYSGKQLIYLEAGSGAKYPVSLKIISEVRNAVDIPLIVGGGIRNAQQRTKVFKAGADMVVMGTVFEK